MPARRAAFRERRPRGGGTQHHLDERHRWPPHALLPGSEWRSCEQPVGQVAHLGHSLGMGEARSGGSPSSADGSLWNGAATRSTACARPAQAASCVLPPPEVAAVKTKALVTELLKGLLKELKSVLSRCERVEQGPESRLWWDANKVRIRTLVKTVTRGCRAKVVKSHRQRLRRLDNAWRQATDDPDNGQTAMQELRLSSRQPKRLGLPQWPRGSVPGLQRRWTSLIVTFKIASRPSTKTTRSSRSAQAQPDSHPHNSRM